LVVAALSSIVLGLGCLRLRVDTKLNNGSSPFSDARALTPKCSMGEFPVVTRQTPTHFLAEELPVKCPGARMFTARRARSDSRTVSIRLSFLRAAPSLTLE
jgi:hypothetical protein